MIENYGSNYWNLWGYIDSELSIIKFTEIISYPVYLRVNSFPDTTMGNVPWQFAPGKGVTPFESL